MTSKKGVPKMDVLPEHFSYRDNGCEVSQSCLRCPLPKCKHDDPGWLRSYRRAQRDRLLRVRRRENASVGELAQRFQISERTVHRILARANGGRLASLRSASRSASVPCIASWRGRTAFGGGEALARVVSGKVREVR